MYKLKTTQNNIFDKNPCQNQNISIFPKEETKTNTKNNFSLCFHRNSQLFINLNSIVFEKYEKPRFFEIVDREQNCVASLCLRAMLFLSTAFKWRRLQIFRVVSATYNLRKKKRKNR